MAVSMENPQDPEHASVLHFVRYRDADVVQPKHESKYPKRRRNRHRRGALSAMLGDRQPQWTTRNVIAFAFSVVLTALLVQRSLSLFMAHRMWINAPITYMPRTCHAPPYATLPPSQAGKICITTLTDRKRKSAAQRVLRWRNFDTILQLTWPNKMEYAHKHGYHLYDASHLIDTSRPPAWSKIKAVQALLDGSPDAGEEPCDWVVWTDADTVIMNSDKRIEDFLPADQTKDLLVGSDKGGGFNSGVFVVRNSAWSRAFLQEWWDMSAFVNPPGLSLSGDNHALKALLRDMVDFDAHVLEPSRCTFNSFAQFLPLSESAAVVDRLDKQPWYMSQDYYHKGDFLAHVPGYDNKEQCLQLLLQEAA